MKQFILKENVLTDDVLILSDKGKVFKGNYIAVVKFYKYQSPWSDKENVKRFRNEKSLYNFLDKHYTNLDYLDLDFTNTNLNN
jgi:hypothetical protein